MNVNPQESTGQILDQVNSILKSPSLAGSGVTSKTLRLFLENNKPLILDKGLNNELGVALLKLRDRIVKEEKFSRSEKIKASLVKEIESIVGSILKSDLDELPLELKTKILVDLADTKTGGPSVLAAPAVTSKQMNEAAEEAKLELYRKGVPINDPRMGFKTPKSAIDFLVRHKLDRADLKNLGWVEEKDLKRLMDGCPNITHLSLHLVNNIELDLSKFTQLKSLDIDYAKISLFKLPNKFDNLEQLRLTGPDNISNNKKINEFINQLLESAPHLTSFAFTGCIDPESMNKVCKKTGLKNLELDTDPGPELTEIDVSELVNLENLKFPIDSTSLVLGKTLEKLHSLEVRTGSDDEDQMVLTDLLRFSPNLKTLSVDGLLDQSVLDSIEGNKTITTLKISHILYTLGDLSPLTNLQRLILDCPKLGYFNFHNQVPQLKSFEVSAANLKILKLPDEIPFLEHFQVSSAKLRSFEFPANAPELKTCAFKACTGLDQMVLPENAPQLNRIDLFGCVHLNHDEIKNYERHKSKIHEAVSQKRTK